MNLPADFLQYMRFLPEHEYSALMAAFEQPPIRGLRVNTLKLSPPQFAALSPFPLQPSLLCRDGFILETDQRLGRHPLHHAGLFYVQEPSASAVIEALDPQPGMHILDLCAAPGGKSTHIAARLQGEGLLLANECVTSRVRALDSNLERMGARNVVITSGMPDALALEYPACFDAVVVDAPCSGEGLFRREEAALREWSAEHVKGCVQRQLQILDSAAEMLRRGGILIYSTCTMNPYENEGVIESFLSAHPEFAIEPIRTVALPSACPEAIAARPDIRYGARLMPHTVKGEGHFIARLRKTDGEANVPFASEEASLTPAQQAVFLEFWADIFTVAPWFSPVLRGDSVYLSPGNAGNSVRSGVLAGSFAKNRFVPAHGLFLAASSKTLSNQLSLPLDDPRLAAYLRGEELPATEARPGWCSVVLETAAGAFPLGFGKISGGQLKNHYPKGLRNFK